MCVEVWHGEGVDDGFFELGDYGGEAADVVECHGDVVRSDDVHGDGLLVVVEDEVLFVGAVRWAGRVVIFGARRGGGAVEAAEDGGGGGALGLGFLGLVRFDAGEGVSDEVVDGDVLGNGGVLVSGCLLLGSGEEENGKSFLQRRLRV